MKVEKFFKVMVMLLLVLTIVVACASDNGQQGDDTTAPAVDTASADVTTDADADPTVIRVWSFTDELPQMINDYFKRDHPGVIEMEFTMVDNAEFEAKLDPALAAGNGPDLWGINVAIVNKYVNGGVLADMSHLLERAHELEIAQYVIDLGTDTDGILRTLAFQATPGGVWYRRDLAEQYLGVSEPEDVGPMLSTLDGMLDVARTLRDASDGTVFYTASVAELANLFLARRESPYVVDDTIVIDPAIVDFMEFSRMFMEEGLVAGFDTWGPDWFAGISDSAGEDRIFSYTGATWMINFVLRPNAESPDGARNTYGDWALVEGPGFFYHGGTFWGVNAASPVLETTMEVFEYLTLDAGFIRDYAVDTADFPASAVVARDLAEGMSNSFLGGQNHFAIFNAIVGNVRDLHTVHQNDEFILDALVDQTMLYATGAKDLETALNDFQSAVISLYPFLSRAD